MAKCAALLDEKFVEALELPRHNEIKGYIRKMWASYPNTVVGDIHRVKGVVDTNTAIVN